MEVKTAEIKIARLLDAHKRSSSSASDILDSLTEAVSGVIVHLQTYDEPSRAVSLSSYWLTCISLISAQLEGRAWQRSIYDVFESHRVQLHESAGEHWFLLQVLHLLRADHLSCIDCARLLAIILIGYQLLLHFHQ